MQRTYENFRKLAVLQPDADLSELTEIYQKTKDPIIFSYIFCKLFPLSVSHVNKYFKLTEEDKASFCTEELSKSMLDYDPNKGAKIQTLYVHYLENRLRSETWVLNHDVRKGNYGAESLDASLEGYFGEAWSSSEKIPQSLMLMISGESDKRFDTIDLRESLSSYNLTDNELSYCRLVTKYTSLKDTDVAKILGISSAGINYIRKSLSKKLGPSLCF